MLNKIIGLFSLNNGGQKPQNTPQINNAQQQQMLNNVDEPYFQIQNTSNQYQIPNQHTTLGLRLLRPREQDKKVVAIIVTFCSGCSYDNLFTTVEQKSIDGTQVLVYACQANYLSNLIKAFNKDSVDDISKQLIKYISQVDPDCVVFNWECSSSYSSKKFSQGRDNLFSFLKMVVDKGHMAMFSDFSLKALIAQWDSKFLGPNPFIQTGQTSSPVELRFSAGELKQCPSAQLQTVGQMAQGGKCNVGVAGGTIVYSVDHKQASKSDIYKLKVLTVVNNSHVKSENLRCKIGQFSGSAGHVLLTFKSGGHILTSMTHWIQLMKIDTSQKKLFEIAERQYGIEKVNRMKKEYQGLNLQEKRSYVSKNAVQFVQNQAPCTNMYRKANNSNY